MGRLAWRGGAGVGVVERCDEADARRLEWVVGREAQVEHEGAALIRRAGRAWLGLGLGLGLRLGLDAVGRHRNPCLEDQCVRRPRAALGVH